MSKAPISGMQDVHLFRKGQKSFAVNSKMRTFLCLTPDEELLLKSGTLKSLDEIRRVSAKGITSAPLEQPISRLVNSKILSLTPGDSRGPVNFLALELTKRCNLRCKYCYFRAQHEEKSSVDMSLEIGKAAFDRLFDAPLSRYSVSFFGGEPLLNFSVLRELVLYGK